MPVTKRDYYEILGISKSAAADEVKKAYRTLAMKHHPDRVPAEHKKEAEEKFKEISEAYAVLSDQEKRAVYDQYGHTPGFDQRYSTEDIFRNADFSSIFGDVGGGSVFEDLLGGLFGFSSRGTGRQRNGRGADLQYELELTFEEAAKGVSKTIRIARHEACPDCHGDGGKRVTCTECKGTGQIRQSSGFMVIARTCPKCRGQASIVTKACARCHGDGRITVERTIDVKIPAGIESGMRLRVSGEGEGGARGRGDLYVLVLVAPHPVFKREGSHLIIEYPVSLTQAALGDDADVPTLNGHVAMKIPAGTQSGTVFRVRGKGLLDVHSGRTGDLLVQVVVETPTNLTGKQRQLLQEFAESLGTESYPSKKSFVDKLKRIVR